ncbi:MAG TPA: fluoride efflux transporter CrcB [Luteitalea sp.]|nr:fluoride efflux transporter CrcB [Luteitalea sp.]
MHSLWLVAIGGALGAVARMLLAAAIQAAWPSRLPWGTIIVNLTGCLVLGLLIGTMEARPQLPSAWRTFGAVGVLGAFTTFSTFEAETLGLLQRGDAIAALINVLLSVTAGLAAVWAGQAVARLL